MAPERQNLSRFILQNHPKLDESQAFSVAGFFREELISKGDIFLSRGKISNAYYYLESGCVRSYTQNLEGEDVTTGLYSSHSIVCELMSFFKRIPAQENYQALSDCKTWCISFEEVQTAFHSLPEFREFGRAMLVNEYGALKTRMLSTLHETAEERYAALLLSNPDIFQYAPLKNIASFLGVTDTSLSRIRKEVTKKRP